MEFIKEIIEIIIHIDRYLDLVIKSFGNWSYLLFFIIIFAETGLVITPFLPGDSLLFALGALGAIGSFNLLWLFITLVSAAIIGDSVNYSLGKLFGQKIILKGNYRFFKKEHIEKTHKFYEKHGGKAIILARFIPIIRTFAPFVAGVGEMSYCKFFIYNVTGALLWVSIFLLGGYYFGNAPVIKENFFIVILVIIALSVAPVAIEFWRHRKAK
jgi:membrane-associated protein